VIAVVLPETSVLVHAGIVAGALSAIIGLFYVLARAVRSVQAVSIAAISAAVDASRTGHLVDYHLGPNDGTTPLHERVNRTEVQLKLHRQTEPKGHS
jgi:hypothetical protein